jgi:hypothetical protein
MYWGFLANDSAAGPLPASAIAIGTRFRRPSRRITEASGDRLTIDGVGAAPAAALR